MVFRPRQSITQLELAQLTHTYVQYIQALKTIIHSIGHILHIKINRKLPIGTYVHEVLKVHNTDTHRHTYTLTVMGVIVISRCQTLFN